MGTSYSSQTTTRVLIFAVAVSSSEKVDMRTKTTDLFITIDAATGENE